MGEVSTVYVGVVIDCAGLIAELEQEAARYKVAALVVRFDTGDDYVFITDKPSPVHRLEKMIAAEGDPIAIVMAQGQEPDEVSVVVRFLTDFFGDPPSPLEKAKVVREFRLYIKERGRRVQ